MDALLDGSLRQVFSYLQRSDVIAWSRVNTYWYARVARVYKDTLYRGLVITLMPDKTIHWQGQWTKGKWVSRARLEIDCPGNSRRCRWPASCDLVSCDKGHMYPYRARFVTDAHGSIRQPEDFKLAYGYQNLARLKPVPMETSYSHLLGRIPYETPWEWTAYATRDGHYICLRNLHLVMDEIHRFLWIVRFWENNHPLLSPNK